MKKTPLLACFGLFFLVSQAVFSADGHDSKQKALIYLNELRQQSGMIPFKLDDRLNKSSQAHALYLQSQRSWGHSESRSSEYFTGETPMLRMLQAGYPSRHNSENVSSHQGMATAVKSINGLMSAIYHRFGFLSFSYDEIGIGYASDNDFHSYVYNLGNSLKAQLCETPQPPPTQGSYVFKVCANEKKQISKQLFDQAQTKVQLQNKPIVVWPADGAQRVPPGFYDEAPDPLPSYEVSGYPVSVQFNPAYHLQGMPVVRRFELFEADSDTPVRIISFFNEQTDINNKFDNNEFAIFPTYRLKWDQRYRAEVDYVSVDGKSHQLTWQFATAGFDQPFHEVMGGENLPVAEEGVVVYSPPVSAQDGKSEYLVSYRGFSRVDVTILDAHTLLIKPSGQSGQAMFDFHGKRFSVSR